MHSQGFIPEIKMNEWTRFLRISNEKILLPLLFNADFFSIADGIARNGIL